MIRPITTKENTSIVEQQPETIEQVSVEQPGQIAARPAVLTRSQALSIFLVCMLLGFIGTLTGVVPLVALAMIGPVVVSFLI